MTSIQPVYSLAQIFESRRNGKLEELRKEKEAAEAKRKAAEAPNDSGESSDVRPEGELGILWDGKKYLEAGLAVIDTAFSLAEQLRKIAEEATDSKLDDNDRKGLNKTLKEVRRTFNQSVGNARVHGDPLFSGKFSKSPKRIPLGTGEEEKMNIHVPALTSFELGLDRLAINSQVNARKTVLVMDKVVEDIQSVMNAFRQKRDLILLKMKNLAFTTDEKKPSAKFSIDSVRTSLELKYVEFKLLQEERAKVTGQMQGLIIDKIA